MDTTGNRKLTPGELVNVVSWESEGEEKPWGLDPSLPTFKGRWTSRRTAARRIDPGSIAIVLQCDPTSQMVIEDYDEHVLLLVNGEKLSVPVRFVKRVER